MSKTPVIVVGIGGVFAVLAGIAQADALAYGLSAVSAVFLGGGVVTLVAQSTSKVLSGRAQARQIDRLETRLEAAHEQLDSASLEVAQLKAQRHFDEELKQPPRTD